MLRRNFFATLLAPLVSRFWGEPISQQEHDRIQRIYKMPRHLIDLLGECPWDA